MCQAEQCMENFSNGITPQLNKYLPTPDMLDHVLAILKESNKLDQARTMQVEELREYVNRRYRGVARRRSLIPHKMEYSTRNSLGKHSKPTTRHVSSPHFALFLQVSHQQEPQEPEARSIHHHHDQRRGLPATSAYVQALR